MFNKNNIKHILILALGFFSCSSIYLIESLLLKSNSSIEFANTVSVLFGSFSMALGILLYSLLYKNTKNIKKYYILFMIIFLLSFIIAFIIKDKFIISICLCLSCLFGTSGFGAGYHYSLISVNIYEKYQGRVYSIGYALGSTLTYLLTFIPNYTNNIVVMILNILILFFVSYLVISTKSLINNIKEEYTNNIKKFLVIISIIVISMAILTSISQDIIGTYTLNNNNWFADTRIHYSLGLIIGGIIYDKRKDVFDILLLISFIYPLISIVLLKENISLFNIAGLSYFFLGFFSVFKALSFIALGCKSKKLIGISAYGYMLERIIEGTFMLVQKSIIDNYMALIIIESVFFAIVIGLYLFFYLNKNQTEIDKIKNLAIKNSLSIQEEKVLRLLMMDLSNQEIADSLYVSVNTIRNQVASIYKKTGMKKKELREMYHCGTK